MDIYVLHQSADRDRFFEICEVFEKEFASFKKLAPFEDKRAGALYQRFELGHKAIVICLESLWNERIIARANFDISEFVSGFKS